MTYTKPIQINLNDGSIFKVEYDDCFEAGDARECSAGTILTTDNRYWVGDEVIGRDIDEYEVDDFLKKIIDDGGVVLPITMYVHSGITVWHSDFENRYADSWDSGTVGFSYMTAEKIKQEYGTVDDETREKAKKLLDYELKEIDCLLRGEVYRCSLFDENGLQDCIGGFYCYDRSCL